MEGEGTANEVHGGGGYVAELPVAGGILTAHAETDMATLMHDYGLVG